MISDSNEVQSHIESLFERESQRKEELEAEKSKYKKIQVKENKPKKVEFRENIFITSPLIPGKRVFFRIIQATIHQLQQKMKSVFKAPENSQLAYNINGRIIALRNDDDLYALGYYFFSNNLVSVEINVIPEIKDIKVPEQKRKGNVEGTFICHHSQMSYSLLLKLDEFKTFEKGKEFLQGIFGEPTSLSFEDSEGDSVELESDDSWEYMMSQSKNSIEKGNYLSVELTF